MSVNLKLNYIINQISWWLYIFTEFEGKKKYSKDKRVVQLSFLSSDQKHHHKAQAGRAASRAAGFVTCHFRWKYANGRSCLLLQIKQQSRGRLLLCQCYRTNSGLATLSVSIMYKLGPPAHFFSLISDIPFNMLGCNLPHWDK